MRRALNKTLLPCLAAKPLGEAGVTLLELMVAMAVSIIVIVTVTNTMVGASRSAVSIRLDSVSNSLLSQFQAIFRDSKLCAAAWKDASGNPFDVNRTTLAVATDVIHVPRFDLNGAYIAREGKFSSGLKVTHLDLTNPIQIAGNRYLWTFKITTDKTDNTGVSLGGTPIMIHSFRIAMTTNEGSPDWHVVSCGLDLKTPPPVAPAPIAASLTQVSAGATAAAKDGQCNKELGSGYTAASTLDFLQIRAAPSDAGMPTSAIPMVVWDDAANVYALDSGPPAVVSLGRRLRTVSGGSSGQVACVSRTAPLRFTRATIQTNAGDTAMNSLCNKEFGPAYNAAQALDIVGFGFSQVTTGAAMNNSKRIAVASTSSGCLVGYNNPVGPGLDCLTTSGSAAVPLACILRAN